MGLAALFLALTIPLLLSNQWITASWALQALVMLWIAGKLNSQFLRQLAYVLYAIVVFRFGMIDLRRQFEPAVPSMALDQYLWLVAERAVSFGVPIASMGAAFVLLRREQPASAAAIDPANDVEGYVRQPWALVALLVAGAAMLFLYLHLELNRTVGVVAPPLRLPVLTLLWLAMCVALLVGYRGREHPMILGALGLFVAAVLVKLVAFDLPAWTLTDRFFYDGPYAYGEAGLRLLDFGAVIAFCAWAFFLLVKQPSTRTAGTVLGATGLALLFVYTTLELNTFLLNSLPGFRAGGISVLWSLFALALLLAGIRKAAAPLRYVGLALFTVVAAKVFFVDLAHLDQIYRIIAFVVLGVLLLCGSFLYLKYRQDFAIEPPSAAVPAPPPERPTS
jgi:uncharacterized membrane protein